MSNPITFFSTHTGAGGADCGAIAAGLTPVGGIEIDPYPVALYRSNFGDHIRHESILDTDPKKLPDFDFFWSSPPCPSFSTAKTNGQELPEDIAQAEKVAEIIRVKRPRYFALENVRGYAQSQSFAAILSRLDNEGYNYHWAVYDAADFGVPQKRDRLILRASRDPLPNLEPTHSKHGGLWWQPWNGWYSAIADLLPSCKPSRLTERQIIALEKKGWYGDIQKALAVSSEYLQANGKPGRADELPIGTVTTQSKPLAVLVEGSQNFSREACVRQQGEPSQTVTAKSKPSELPRAVLVEGNKNGIRQAYTKGEDEPSHTICASADRPNHLPRAVLIDGKANSYGSSVTSVDGSLPAYSVTASTSKQLSRAVLLERVGYGKERDPTIRTADDPSITIRASAGCDELGGFRSPLTALLEYADIRALDYRCLARLQSFPDSYQWGKSAGKNCRAIGNAIPALFAQRVIESIVRDAI